MAHLFDPVKHHIICSDFYLRLGSALSFCQGTVEVMVLLMRKGESIFESKLMIFP